MTLDYLTFTDLTLTPSDNQTITTTAAAVQYGLEKGVPQGR